VAHKRRDLCIDLKNNCNILFILNYFWVWLSRLSVPSSLFGSGWSPSPQFFFICGDCDSGEARTLHRFEKELKYYVNFNYIWVRLSCSSGLSSQRGWRSSPCWNFYLFFKLSCDTGEKNWACDTEKKELCIDLKNNYDIIHIFNCIPVRLSRMRGPSNLGGSGSSPSSEYFFRFLNWGCDTGAARTLHFLIYCNIMFTFNYFWVRLWRSRSLCNLGSSVSSPISANHNVSLSIKLGVSTIFQTIISIYAYIFREFTASQ
jgi:hypothetical protein